MKTITSEEVSRRIKGETLPSCDDIGTPTLAADFDNVSNTAFVVWGLENINANLLVSEAVWGVSTGHAASDPYSYEIYSGRLNQYIGGGSFSFSTALAPGAFAFLTLTITDNAFENQIQCVTKVPIPTPAYLVPKKVTLTSATRLSGEYL